jgi:hypothetical protein
VQLTAANPTVTRATDPKVRHIAFARGGRFGGGASGLTGSVERILSSRDEAAASVTLSTGCTVSDHRLEGNDSGDGNDTIGRRARGSRAREPTRPGAALESRP